jgi:hypothetical protein
MTTSKVSYIHGPILKLKCIFNERLLGLFLDDLLKMILLDCKVCGILPTNKLNANNLSYGRI